MDAHPETRFVAKAARGRIDAINSAKHLHWVVDAGDVILTFDKAPTMLEVVDAAKRQGAVGLVRIRSLTARPKKQRCLLLTPMQRVRALSAAAAAAAE